MQYEKKKKKILILAARKQAQAQKTCCIKKKRTLKKKNLPDTQTLADVADRGLCCGQLAAPCMLRGRRECGVPRAHPLAALERCGDVAMAELRQRAGENPHEVRACKVALHHNAACRPNAGECTMGMNGCARLP
jgi:hypothetical protein